ncbi:hypothetical protein TheetDRAFT_2868 [Thermoanaerobacter ethanolicus JW 200]|nr:hypothetical protein TheetDRAFT_2868 [Thermoanaerobacter ethanolicus JW 200]
MSVAYQVKPTVEKKQEIRKLLSGYWGNDVWDIRDSFLMTYALQSGVYPIKLLTFHPLALQSKMKLSICMLTDCRKGN